MDRGTVWYNVCQVIEDLEVAEFQIDVEQDNFIADGSMTLLQIGLDEEDLEELLDVFESEDEVHPDGITLETTLDELVDELHRLINA